MPLLSSSIHRRICPGLNLVVAPCRTMVLACTGGFCGGGVRLEVRVDVVEFAGGAISATWSGCTLGRAGSTFALPLPLVSFGCGIVRVHALGCRGGGVVEIAASV